jgi:ABC-2 type transport system ATP-binding protein
MEAGEIRADGEPERLMAEMGVNVVEAKAANLRQLKNQLLQCQEVRSAAQIGARLRILIYQQVAQPLEWLKQRFPELAQAELNLARPSLEDVFVSVTGAGRQ